MRGELVAAVLIPCSAFLLKPVFNKPWDYTLSYAAVGFVLLPLFAVVRYLLAGRRERR